MTSRGDGEARLAAALEAVGGNPAHAPNMFDGLRARYSEPQRFYHTMRHLESCLTWLDGYRGHAQHAAEVELALWFHDAVYDPRRSDNEQRSAELAVQELACAGASSDAAARVEALILSTAGHAARTGDQALLISVDLAILGAEPGEYDAFEDAVRREYAHVPAAAYGQGRAAVLGAFLSRENIYPCRAIGEVLEAPARRNLAAALQRFSRSI